MKELVAYDFDKTLIPYDSFRRYLMHLLRLRPVRIGALLLLRKVRILSAAQLKERVTHMVEHSAALTRETKHFAQRLIYDLQMPERTTKGGVVLIISASPKIYMHYVAEIIGCDLMCSDYMSGWYVEMYGTTKAEALHAHYSQTEYAWTYALSDSESDLCWMKEFENFEFVKNQ